MAPDFTRSRRSPYQMSCTFYSFVRVAASGTLAERLNDVGAVPQWPPRVGTGACPYEHVRVARRQDPRHAILTSTRSPISAFTSSYARPWLQMGSNRLSMLIRAARVLGSQSAAQRPL